MDDVRGPGRVWGRRLKKDEKRTTLVAVRITPQDAKRLKAVLDAFDEDEKVSASTYAARVLLKALERDERRLAVRRSPKRK